MTADKLGKMLEEHPCYNEAAHTKFARMHLPVAPHCNIQCNYCNRKYDCSNESRPGVTSDVLTPEQALDRVRAVKEKIPQLSVVGIAGPGDPMANEATFRTLELVKRHFPELTLCISTNGLALPENTTRLHDLGVRFVTVTMNACDPKIGAEVYGSVVLNGKKHTGEDGARILMDRQKEGIRACAKLGMLVKVNVVMVPGINDGHIPRLVKEVRALGAYIVNILPLIPVEGTPFGSRRAPTAKERKDLMDLCSIDAKMMRHCKQCRADAIGLLNEDRSSEFALAKCGSCIKTDGAPIAINVGREDMLAVATSDGKNVDSGFGNTPRFDIYLKKDGCFEFLRTVRTDNDFEVSGATHRERLEARARLLENCGTVVVKEIGSMPAGILAKMGIGVTVSKGMIADVLNSI